MKTMTLIAVLALASCGVGVGPVAPDYAEAAQEIGATDAGATCSPGTRCENGIKQWCQDGRWVTPLMTPPPRC